MAAIAISRGHATALTVVLLAAPICLTACSASAALGDSTSASLRSAAGSDVLAAPVTERFTADTTAIGSLREESGEVIDSSELTTSGSLTLMDGVITQADIRADAVGAPGISFLLTEPIVLRRDGMNGETVDAVGTLVVGSLERPDTTIRITPDFLGDTANMVATIDMPSSLAQSFPDESRVLEVVLTLSATP